MMQPANTPSAIRARAARRQALSASVRPALSALLLLLFVLWAHFGSGQDAFTHQSHVEPGWEDFRETYGVDDFGRDGYFVRAVQNGFNLTHYTHKYAWRFTRKTAQDAINSCSDCHSNEDLAYAFVTGDRFNPELGRRLSFEEAVMRCYASHMDGFVPTLYDPAVRDIRIFARMIAHHLQLSEGQPGVAP